MNKRWCWQTVYGFKSPPTQSPKTLAEILKNELKFNILMKFYLLDSTFDFGQYKGKTLEYVANENAMYIEWCIINVDSFLISHYVALEIKKKYSRFLFNVNSQRKLEEKTTEYWEYLDNKAQSEYIERESNWDNDYYNDSLDIDQQDAEWWDSL